MEPVVPTTSRRKRCLPVPTSDMGRWCQPFKNSCPFRGPVMMPTSIPPNFDVNQSMKSEWGLRYALRLHLSLTPSRSCANGLIVSQGIRTTLLTKWQKSFSKILFPPSMVTKMRNDDYKFSVQRPMSPLFEAWER
ncbi:hypothetical protein Tco_1008118 [Tanacetum coccineum]|uniref:Uncharacterized protein n=1 Tax=Tanacetum coccineum TaxID=301880 RepID=A0ABQ5DIM9_9ASTR